MSKVRLLVICDNMKRENKVNEKNCNANSCGCNANYLLLGVIVIFLVMYVATTIK